MFEIINFARAYRYYLNPELVEDPIRAINNLKALSYEKNSRKANLIAGLIKKLRAIAPYEVKDFSEAKKLYEDYFKMEKSIISIESLQERVKSSDVYVKLFRNEIPVKGKRYCEYYINGSYGPELNTVYKINKGDMELRLNGLDIKSFGFNYLSDANLMQFKYAELADIGCYARAEVLINHNNEKIKQLNDEIIRLSKENNKNANFNKI